MAMALLNLVRRRGRGPRLLGLSDVGAVRSNGPMSLEQMGEVRWEPGAVMGRGPWLLGTPGVGAVGSNGGLTTAIHGRADSVKGLLRRDCRVSSWPCGWCWRRVSRNGLFARSKCRIRGIAYDVFATVPPNVESGEEGLRHCSGGRGPGRLYVGTKPGGLL